VKAGELRAYLETTVLCGSSWPPWSSRIEYAAELVKKLGGVLIVPDPVEREAEHHNLREISADYSEISGKLTRLPPSSRTALEKGLSSFDLEKVRNEYRELYGEWKRRLSIESCPLTTKSLDDFFAMAIAHEIPFSEEGRGFQDVVIYQSVLEDLARHPSSVGVLIAKDQRYRSEELRSRERAEGIQLRAETLEDAIKFLDSQSSEEQRRVREHEKGTAKAALLRLIPNIEQFVRENLVFTADSLNLTGDVVAIEELKVTGIDDVAIAHSGEADTKARERRVTVVFNADLEVRLINLTPRRRLSPTGIRAVDDPRVVGMELLTPSFGSRERRILTLAPKAEIDATAIEDDRGYRDFAFKSVRLRPRKEWKRDPFGILSDEESMLDRFLPPSDLKPPDSQ
jgi:hypothetical protein